MDIMLQLKMSAVLAVTTQWFHVKEKVNAMTANTNAHCTFRGRIGITRQLDVSEEEDC